MENLDSAKKQLEREIMEAYIFLRKENMTVPSETLEFMKDAAIQKLNNKTQDINKKLLFALEMVEKQSGIIWDSKPGLDYQVGSMLHIIREAIKDAKQ